MLATSNAAYLQQLNEGYAAAHGHTVAKALEREMGGWLGKTLMALGARR